MSTASSPRRDGGDDPDGDHDVDRDVDGVAASRGLLRGTTRLSLFGEVGMVGVVVALLSLLVVTAVPALAAGARHLRRHLSGEGDSIGRLLRDVGPALRDLWGLAILVPVVLAVTAWNLWLVAYAGLAGGAVIAIVSAAVGAAAIVVTLRTVATWNPGDRGRDAVGAATQRARRDLSGSALLVVAAVLCVVLIWMLEAFVLLVGGLLAMAGVAVEHRRALQDEAGEDR